MFKNYLSVITLAFICAFSLNEISAQNKEVTKKVIVIEKTVDNDGNVTSKKVIKEGAEAEAYINQLNQEENIEIEIDDKTPTRIVNQQSYKVKTVDDNGNEEVIEWNGEGEMPKEIEEMLKQEGININHSKSAQVIIKEVNGEKEHIEIDLEEDELSDEVIQLLKEENIGINIKEASNKPQLGVMILNTDDHKVKISDIVEGTAADEGGLEEGDIIEKINDTKIKDTDHLIATIKDHKVGDKIRIGITRNGERTYKDIVLKKAVKSMEVRSMSSTPKWKDVERDVEIIIDNKK